jgi:glutathione S-transferase
MDQFPLYQNPYEKIEISHLRNLKLHRFGIADPDVKRFVPNLSPSPTKLECFLRFLKIPFETVIEPTLSDAPRRKVPWISIDGVRISDSDLIVSFLQEKVFDLDAELTADQKTIGHLVQRTLEDHFYWIILYYEFFDDVGSDYFFRVAYLGHSDQTKAIRDDFARRVYDQGTGRYTPAEIVEKASKDLLAVSTILGGKTFLLGTPKPTSFDAVVFGLLLAIFQARGMHPEVTDFARGIPNLADYMRRLITQYWPELELAF